MCGLIEILLADESSHVNQLIFDGLTVLQHRGQGEGGSSWLEDLHLYI